MSFGSAPAAPPPPPPPAPPPTLAQADANARDSADAFRRRRGTQANIQSTGSGQVTTAAARLLGS